MGYPKIPTICFPSISEYAIADYDEELVSISESGITCQSQYYEQGIAGALRDCYCRKSVLGRLLMAEKMLPKGLHLKVYDAYRPICVQQRLWDHYYGELKVKNPNFTPTELERRTAFFVSKPSYDEDKPSLHNTGGAIDVTLITDNGFALNMGTLFDDFTERAWTNHFELYEACPEVCENRRILYNTMTAAGFTNLPSEWWHYDYGTKFWGYFTGNNALYKGILDARLPNRFPLI